MRGFMPELIERLLNGTFTKEDITYCVWTLQTKAERKHNKYLKHKVTKPDLNQTKAPDKTSLVSSPIKTIDPEKYYLKLRSDLALHITKDIVVAKSDEMVIGVISKGRLILPKIRPSTKITAEQTKRSEGLIRFFTYPIERMEFDKLQTAINRLPKDEPIIINYANRSVLSTFYNISRY